MYKSDTEAYKVNTYILGREFLFLIMQKIQN